MWTACIRQGRVCGPDEVLGSIFGAVVEEVLEACSVVVVVC